MTDLVKACVQEICDVVIDNGELARAIVETVFRTVEFKGFRIVPVEPTPEMMQAAADKDPHADVQSEYGYAVAVDTAADLWSAMLAAFPKVT